MSVVLIGNGFQTAMVTPGRPMLVAPLPGTPSPPGPPTTPTDLSATSGLTGWWDAGVPSGVLDPTGHPLTAFANPAGGVADKSGAGGNLAVWHATSGTNNPAATPRLNGLLGGIGLNLVVPPTLPAVGQLLPLMDPDQGLISNAMNLGSGTPWTLFLVWSRPNWRQSSTAVSTLLTIGGTTVLAADNAGGTRLMLFPGASQTILTTRLTRRHSHAILIRNTPGVGVDVWLDAAQVAAAAQNPSAATFTAPLLFLHNGTISGGAECWFHEAAIWNNALSGSDITTVLAYQTRWTLGPRRGIQILVTGQSNAGNGLNDGAWHLLAQGVAWHLGALGYSVIAGYGTYPGATCIHGEGIYPVPALGLSGSFLNNPGDGSNPSTWTFGSDGLQVQTYILTQTPALDAAEISVILWPWSEDDSTRQYSEKATYEAAARRFLSLERGLLSRPAAESAPGLVVGHPVPLWRQ